MLQIKFPLVFIYFFCLWNYRGADKSLARPGRKQATATKLTTFASHSKVKKLEGCRSNRVSTAAMTSTSDEKWPTFNCFFSRVGLKTYLHPDTVRYAPAYGLFHCSMSLSVKWLPLDRTFSQLCPYLQTLSSFLAYV